MQILKNLKFLLFYFVISTHCQDEEFLSVELELADMELQDDCEYLAQETKTSLTQDNSSCMINAEMSHGSLLKNESIALRNFDTIPLEVERNWTVLVKSGDALLTSQHLHTLVRYYVGNEELMRTTKIRCAKDKNDCPLVRKVYDDILETYRNESVLQRSWSAWQYLLSTRKNDFPNILNLVNEAAIKNEENNAKSYWQMLMDIQDSYEKADAFWSEIQPFYLKLHNFVKTRIFQIYNITDDRSEIPVYLLGSNFGNDWSYVADIVLPHPQIYYNAKTYLNKQSVKHIYKLAENLTYGLGLGRLGDRFWSKSTFNMSLCENRILSFCSQGYSELITCDKTSYVSYLDAFETALDISLRNKNYLTLPRLRLRYSIIDEAVKSLGSVLAITNMKFNGILNKELFSSSFEEDPNKMTELLLTALRVVPKLPFYLAADKWRLYHLENGFRNMDKMWWQYRKEYQGVNGINYESDYLGDPYIISNKPYLSKFFGIILQFQILQYYKLDETGSKDNVITRIREDEKFLSMIRGSSDQWENVIYDQYYISELSARSLLDYFQPLENYFDSAPLQQRGFTTEERQKVTQEVNETKLKSKNVKTRINNLNSSITTDSKGQLKESEIVKTKDSFFKDKSKSSMYIGIGILAGVFVIVLCVIISKRMKRKRSNNRRFGT